MVRGIIFGSTKDRALKELKKLEERYEKANIKRNKKTKTLLEYENGDSWFAVEANDELIGLGLRAHVAYIDKDLDREYINTLVVPCVMGTPWNAFHYFDIKEE